MIKVDCNIITNEPESLIEVIGLGQESLTIDYSGDIDFTPLVSELSSMIDKENEINLTNTIDENFSDKTKLVLSTLDNIFESYNSTLQTDIEVEQTDSTPSNNIFEDGDDLPF
jgi:hypothetical protein